VASSITCKNEIFPDALLELAKASPETPLFPWSRQYMDVLIKRYATLAGIHPAKQHYHRFETQHLRSAVAGNARPQRDLGARGPPQFLEHPDLPEGRRGSEGPDDCSRHVIDRGDLCPNSHLPLTRVFGQNAADFKFHSQF